MTDTVDRIYASLASSHDLSSPADSAVARVIAVELAGDSPDGERVTQLRMLLPPKPAATAASWDLTRLTGDEVDQLFTLARRAGYPLLDAEGRLAIPPPPPDRTADRDDPLSAALAEAENEI